MSMKTLRFLFALFLIFTAFSVVPARAGIAVSPMTVMISGHQRYADVTVINTGDSVETYEMAWRHMRMQEKTGNYDNVETSPDGDFDLAAHLVFSPRRVTLAPHAAQKIRMALRLDGAVPPSGDYRAHFLLQQTSLPDSAADDDGNEIKDNKVSVRILVGFSVPVVYRVGDGRAKAVIGDVATRINPDTHAIELTVPVTREEGPYGIQGTLGVTYESPDGSRRYIGGLNNANIFREIRERDFTLPLKVKALSGGKLHIVYADANDEKTIYAEKWIPVGK
ncbi:MAG: hypothetical protein H6865_01585 [Rhodospirillales bacterium]|nr:hypothetical protein [Alphaproteobacteria bacterium]MCB9986310.1 hypothetical protein [Rhodospirillales bacterium]USO07137.1 MAG: hypothetical protein H6866_06800 [Rhodospirillales bacterium]